MELELIYTCCGVPHKEELPKPKPARHMPYWHGFAAPRCSGERVRVGRTSNDMEACEQD